MNKMRKILVIAVVVALTGSASRSYGMAENWSAINNTFLTLQGGTNGLPSGCLIEIGILSTNVLALQANQNSISFVDTYFNEWITTTIGTGTAGLAGTWTVNSSAPGAGFFSQQIYLLAYNAASTNGVTQIGLYTNPSWVFPATDGAAAGGFDLSDPGLLAIFGSLSTGTILTPGAIAGGNAAQLHQIVAIPEPSTMLLVGVGLLGAMRLRRRRS